MTDPEDMWKGVAEGLDRDISRLHDLLRRALQVAALPDALAEEIRQELADDAERGPA